MLTGSHNWPLVVLSIAVAIAAAFTALDLAGRMQASVGWARRVWLAAAALAMGGGIWSMHFVGMLAFSLPLPMDYDPGLTVLSLMMAVLFTGLGFTVLGRGGGPLAAVISGGLLMGAGVAAMHYTGMAAMRMPADLHYDGVLVVGSVLIAVGAATVALWLARRNTALPERMTAAVAMGLAVAGMHYTGMAAVTWIPRDSAVGAGGHNHGSLDHVGLALGVAAATFLILLLGLVAALYDRRFAALAEREAWIALRESEARLNLVAESGGIGIWEWDPAANITVHSASWSRLHGLSPEAPAHSWEDWLARLHPDDRSDADSAARAGLAAGTYADEYRVVHADGEVRWIANRGVVLRGLTGRPARFIGVAVDITERHRAETALAESAARQRDLLATLDLGAFMIRDLDGMICFWSEGCAGLYGWTAAEAIGQSAHELLQTVFPVPRSEVEAALERNGQWTGDLRHRTRDGREIVVTAHKLLRHDAEGQPATVLEALTDVTERKRAEELRLLLAREVDHRAKNALAVVLSLLRLTPRADAALFAASIEGRVAAMARAHSLLATEGWRGADLRALAQGELATHPGRISIAGSPVSLRAEAVQPVAMLLHELATNAAKYGALRSAQGSISLTWEGKDGDLHLLWEERGGPPLERPPARLGFGSRLMDLLARQQLGGSLVVNWASAGISCSISVASRFVASAAPAPTLAHTSRGDVEARTMGQQAEPFVRPPLQANERPRVLVVEDEPLLAAELEHILSNFGCEVVGPAQNLAEAVRLALATRDLAAGVLDVNLGNGEVAFTAMDLLETRGVPYIIATGYGSAFSLEGRDRGAVSVLHKPYPQEALLDAIHAAVGQRPRSTPASDEVC
ncbi:MHYT domain-containing protein [Belnapia moabensis]|uniref:MHYT domain-containing protein n=1 Tax=Belnapia moabensis TaxID=365533 RepID=UPI0006938797|nr:MHYT domain-containing protein [Belnapia moabensis]